MKTILIAACLFISFTACCQPDQSRVFCVRLLQTDVESSGWMEELGDSAITIGRMWHGKLIVEKISYDKIHSISLKKKGSTGMGILTGFFVGFGTGALIGAMSGNDDASQFMAASWEEKSLGLGILLAVPGMLIGGIAGSSTHTDFLVGGHYDLYEKFKEEMKKIPAPAAVQSEDAQNWRRR